MPRPPAGGSFENISGAAQSAASQPTGGGGGNPFASMFHTSNPQPGGQINVPSPPQSPYEAWAKGPPKDPWASNVTRLRRFGHRLNTNQFNPQDQKLMGRVKGVADAYGRAQAFRRAGMGQALRYTLGMPELPSGTAATYRATLYRKGVSYHPSIIGHPHQGGFSGHGGFGEGPED